MKRLRKVSASLLASFLSLSMIGAPNINAAYEDYTEEEVDQIEADLRSYNDTMREYGEKFGYSTDRFYFCNISAHPSGSPEGCEYWLNYRKSATNIETAEVDYDNVFLCSKSGICLGISISSILAHNGVISPSDILEGSETLMDIKVDPFAMSFPRIKEDPVIQKVVSYQLRQLAPDFQLDMYYNFAHYDKEKAIDHLLDTARTATEEGKWWLMAYDDTGFTHAVAGMGLVEGEFTLGNQTYDNCILVYDSNAVTDNPETSYFLSATQCLPGGCIFINSETHDVFIPTYFLSDLGANFKIYTLDDYDFMNYNGVINPSDSYTTDVSSLNSVEVYSKGSYSINAVRADGSEYDAMENCGVFLTKPKGDIKKRCCTCDGEQITVQNTDNAAEFVADFVDVRQFYSSTFNGAVNNVFKSEDEFGFDTLGNTSYDVTLVFEEGCYDFAPHYRFDFSGTTDGDFKAVQTDRGIIVSGSNGVQCSLKTSDITRDEDGFIVSAEDNVQNVGLFASESVMISFVDNVPKFFIGENYDEEVEKGDVNCDGTIDPEDASLTLSAYASLATGGTTYLNYDLADWDNDGELDPADASYILSRYAELATMK